MVLTSNNSIRFWAVVPAAGIGVRMAADRPKQYLLVQGKPIIDYTLATLLELPYLERIIVVINPHDNDWSKTHYATHPKIKTVRGGAARADSVMQGLMAIQDKAHAQDWVLVHDAARPCLNVSDISKLIKQLENHPVGGLLGFRTRDTMKMVDAEQGVTQTLDRQNIWHALTPQMFRFKLLMDALLLANKQGAQVTDEASAIERQGYRPLMVEGLASNIKITSPEDLKLAAFYLSEIG